MRNPARTLYWQVAGLFLLLLLAFSAIAFTVAARQFGGFFDEVEQRLNQSLATHLTRELASALDAPTHDGSQRAIRRIGRINPSIDIYLLAPDGRVTASFTGKPAVRDRIDIDVIRQFLQKDAMFPIRAADPGHATGEKVFSAAALPQSAGGGYLYVILPGMPFESAAHVVRTSYILRGAAGVLLAVLVATLLAGLVLFFILTRRFRRLTQTVKKFQEGAYNERADVEPNDQIGRLGATFNEMAARIENQFEALKRTDEARRSLASNISHDFRTPLTALRGFADRMLRAEDRLTPTERRQHLNAVLRSATQLEHLADQLATIVQLDGSSDYALKLEGFSIAELAQDAVVKFTPFAEQRGITLTLMNPEDVPQVIGDIALIERVLANLIDNALQNMMSGGHVEISLPVGTANVTVRIQDTGFGIGSDELPLITQRFFRTRHSRTNGPHGAGLGLSIVNEIVERHGGVLRLESRLGVGTAVSFELGIA